MSQSRREGRERTSHLEAGADFGELDLLVRSFDKDVVPERDEVAVVDEGHCSLRVFPVGAFPTHTRGQHARQAKRRAKGSTNLGTGKMNLRTSRTRPPSLEPNPSKIRLSVRIGAGLVSKVAGESCSSIGNTEGQGTATH